MNAAVHTGFMMRYALIYGIIAAKPCAGGAAECSYIPGEVIMPGLLIRRERMRQNMSQQALCEGICTPSYLSKIENGTARCSDEMIGLLLDALAIHYETDPGLLDAFDRAFEAACAEIVRDQCPQAGEDLAALCGRLLYSPRAVDAALLACLLKGEAISEADIGALDVFRSAYDERQTLLYALAQVLLHRHARRHDLAIACLLPLKKTGQPVVYGQLAQSYFLAGAYREAVEHGVEGYRLFAMRGEVAAMLSLSMLISSSCSNAMDFASAQHWYGVCRTINHRLRDEATTCYLYYNEGATCLMNGRYEQGLRCLLDGEAVSARYFSRYPSMLNLYYQKLAFAWILTGHPQEAEGALAHIRTDEMEESVRASLALLRYMQGTPDYARRKVYCTLLEACLEAAGQETRGRLEFYGQFLLDAYKSTRQYKKAVRLMEQYKLSHFFHQNDSF